MMSKALFATTALFATALAAGPAAKVTIETGHGSSLSNTTVTVPLNTIYKPTSNSISALYLVGASGGAADTISCTPFYSTHGAGSHAGIFGTDTPSHVPSSHSVGSIVCIAESVPLAPPGGSSPSSSAAAGTSSTVTTSSASHTGHSGATTTPGSGYTVGVPPSSKRPTGASGTTTSSAASSTATTSSATASTATGNAASALYLSGEFFGGLALAGFGVAFVL